MFRALGCIWQVIQNSDFKINLKENEVGITEYVSPSEGFQGILKSRYSDFHVNEIGLNGQVLHLNQATVPEEKKDDEMNSEQLDAALAGVKDIITDEMRIKIENLIQKSSTSDKSEDCEVFIDATELNKDKRTEVHKVIKKLYGGKLVSTTVSGEQEGKEPSKKFIKITEPKNGRERNAWSFPGDYVHFLVYKENVDTTEVATGLANRLNLKPSQVNYCGTKDKRAKTTQKFCIKKRSPKQILGSVRHMPRVRVGNFEFSKQVLKLGDLKGNRFRIALRHLIGERAMIENALKNLKELGFINYFGLQRFGNCASIPTFEVGVALLKSDYKLACELILKPRENDLPFLKCIRETWWKNRDSKAASLMFRNDKLIEKKLLDGLAQYGENDYSSALRKLPRNMLLLYPHAFQSLVFNNMASRRVKEFGLKLIVGDLVYRNKDDPNIELDDLQIEEFEESDDFAKELNLSAMEVEKESLFKRKVKSLTETDIESGNYTIYDIVLPLPGYDITYPNNIMKSWYEEFLEHYKLNSQSLKNNVKTYSMPGTYRKLLLKPIDMSWEFRFYSTPEETLIASDWEILKDREKANKIEINATNDAEKLSALLLDFCLPPSAYATMMLRELMKCDTSASGQTNLEEAALQKAFDKDVKEIKKRKAEDIIEVDGASNVKQAKLQNDEKEDSVDKAEVSNKI
uniref:TRUD domain-containing protein n=1 Tax=Glossina brevipalpis TaxID=37001 RepID=A0A1A9WI99_9MUSC